MEKLRKKILMIIPELIVGGAQRSFSRISLALSQHHDVSVVIFNRDLPIAYPHGGELYSLDVAGGKGMLAKGISLIRRIRKLRALKRRLHVDVSISFLEGADYINVLSRVRDKIILSVRGSKLHDETMRRKFHGWRTKLMIPRLYQKADHIIVVNHGIAQELRDHFRILVPVSVIYNFYSPEQIDQLAKAPVDPSFLPAFDFPLIVTTGRLAVEKGLYFLLETFRDVRSHSNAKLMLVGDGPEYEKLVSLCKTLGLSVREKSGEKDEAADVIFAGAQGNVFPFLTNASVYVLASSSEGFPNSLVEAMFCGLPVIAADCPYGPREILTRQNHFRTAREPEYADYGILMPVPAADDGVKKQWSTTIAGLLKDKSLREKYARAGRIRANEFSTDAAITEWLLIIEDQ